MGGMPAERGIARGNGRKLAVAQTGGGPSLRETAATGHHPDGIDAGADAGLWGDPCPAILRANAAPTPSAGDDAWRLRGRGPEPAATRLLHHVPGPRLRAGILLVRLRHPQTDRLAPHEPEVGEEQLLHLPQ